MFNTGVSRTFWVQEGCFCRLASSQISSWMCECVCAQYSSHVGKISPGSEQQPSEEWTQSRLIINHCVYRCAHVHTVPGRNCTCSYVHALSYNICFLVVFFLLSRLNEFKNIDVIDGLDKRSEYKGMLGLHWKKMVSPLNVSATDIQINHCDWILKCMYDGFWSPI